MTTKILNLDELAPKSTKVIKIKGKEYAMQPPSVGTYIRFTRDLQEMEKKEITLVDSIEYMCKGVQEAFPGMEDEVIKSLNVDQLEAITHFIAQRVEEEAEEAKK